MWEGLCSCRGWVDGWVVVCYIHGKCWRVGGWVAWQASGAPFVELISQQREHLSSDGKVCACPPTRTCARAGGCTPRAGVHPPIHTPQTLHPTPTSNHSPPHLLQLACQEGSDVVYPEGTPGFAYDPTGGLDREPNSNQAVRGSIPAPGRVPCGSC